MIKQYKKLFELDGVDIQFTDDALDAVAEKAIQLKTGARGLRGILEDVLGPIMFDSPSDGAIERIVVDGACVRGEGQPEVVRNPQKKPVKLKLSQPAQGRPKRGSVS